MRNADVFLLKEKKVILPLSEAVYFRIGKRKNRTKSECKKVVEGL